MGFNSRRKKENSIKYVKLFKNHSECENFFNRDTETTLNVSHCIREGEVHYGNSVFVNNYFTTIARGSGEISFNVWKDMGTDMITSISYSTDNGETWNTIDNTNDKSEHLVIIVNVDEGDKVMWKGDATQLGCWSPDEDVDDIVGSFFSSTCEFDAQGNVMSLLYEDGFKGKTIIENEYAFTCLFSDYNTQKICEIVNAKNLLLPATTLASCCYYHMFQGCTRLTTAPELPATTLAGSCYSSMFYSCTRLTTAPELPATTLADTCYSGMFCGCTSLTIAPELPATTSKQSCYQNMFNGCTSLTVAPELPATKLAPYCYSQMFQDCTSLTVAPELPATTLVGGCYSQMFQGCTSLTTAPELPATTLAKYCYHYMFIDCTGLTTAPELPAETLVNRCYSNMFQGCTGLTVAPELPATTLEESCYSKMFNGCTSLTTAPELPATTLVKFCYSHMFEGCTNLNYIKALFTTTPSDTYTSNWVDGVASSGTFVKNSAATWTTTGIHGIPTGWNVVSAS